MTVMKWDEIHAALGRAKEAFLQADRDLLETDANERSMTHKFAEYLQRDFQDWNVDCEYNRHGDDAPKRLRWMMDKQVKADDGDGYTVFPDSIVHKRRKAENLLVIEAKKSGNSSDADQRKLDAFMSDPKYRYKYAVLLLFVVDAPYGIKIERVK